MNYEECHVGCPTVIDSDNGVDLFENNRMIESKAFYLNSGMNDII